MNGGRSVTTGKPISLVQAEQRALAHGLVADVRLGMVVRRQRVAFVVIQAVAIGRHARHEDVALQAVAAGPHGGLHLRGGGAALPVVDVVEDHLEAPAITAALAAGVASLRSATRFSTRLAEVVLRLAVQNGDVMAGLQQLRRPAAGR